ncbi:unnamed protein product [Adineta steineri]|uniref:F-box domain-containing protein n=1 Tax=Adineta steineri TaxID=433720 RepID=A0A816BYT4_9BILA|nr:unnamed protein product [Adineta steineri]CAF1615727.1 unnamed protein product [Adineta steineri]
MELLPNEILLQIFSYLHKLDVFHSFNDLNQRFQHIIESCLYEINIIDLGNHSFRRWYFFIKDIFPRHVQSVRSLKLEEEQQFELFNPYISQLTRLESLSLKADNWLYHYDYYYWLNQYLTRALSLSSLTTLTIHGVTISTLKIISLSASRNLHKLIFLKPKFTSNFKVDDIPQMSYVTHLSISLNSTTQLLKLFKLFPNLEKLNLSIIRLDSYPMYHSEIPITLRKLHLQFLTHQYDGYPNLDCLQKFLNIFQSQLHILRLIIINAQIEFSNFDKFQNLIKNFEDLKSFQYNIHTNYKPDKKFPNIKQLPKLRYTMFTLPRIRSFDTGSNGIYQICDLNSNLTLKELFDSCEVRLDRNYYNERFSIPTFQFTNTFVLENLTRICFERCIEETLPEICRFISNIITLSPNLTSFKVHSRDEMKLIQHLKEIFRPHKSNNILNLELIISWENMNRLTTFFYDLSIMFPKINSLVCPSIGQSPRTANLLQDLRTYFPKLNRLQLEMIDQEDFRYFKKYLKESRRQFQSKYSFTIDQDHRNSYGFYTYRIRLY